MSKYGFFIGVCFMFSFFPVVFISEKIGLLVFAFGVFLVIVSNIMMCHKNN